MRDGDIVKEIAGRQKKSLVDVSKELGYSSPSGLYARIAEKTKQGMTTTVMTRILAALDSELIVRDKSGNEWKIG